MLPTFKQSARYILFSYIVLHLYTYKYRAKLSMVVPQNDLCNRVEKKYLYEHLYNFPVLQKWKLWDTPNSIRV